MLQVIFFEFFHSLREIRKKRNPYKPIIKVGPSGVADAYQASEARHSSSAELARKASAPAIIQKKGDGIAAEVAWMRLSPEYRLAESHQRTRPEMGHSFQSGNALRRASIEAAPLRPGRLRVVFRRRLPEAAGRNL